MRVCHIIFSFIVPKTYTNNTMPADNLRHVRETIYEGILGEQYLIVCENIVRRIA